MLRFTYLPGILMILFGVFIVAMPEILVALVASFFIIAGISALGVARAFNARSGTGGGGMFTVNRY